MFPLDEVNSTSEMVCTISRLDPDELICLDVICEKTLRMINRIFKNIWYNNKLHIY